MKSKDMAILAVVALFILFCPVLSSMHRGVESTPFHMIHSSLAVVLILGLNGWKMPVRSRLGFLPSLLFVFGAMYVGIKLYALWFHFTGVAKPLEYAPKAGEAPAYAARYLSGNISLMISAPIVEEIVFRLGLLGVLTRITNKPAALLISTAIFSAAHFATVPQWYMPAIFITAFIMGLTYLLLGLPWAILLHSLYNSQTLLGEVLQSHDAASVLATLLALVGAWVFLSRLFRFRRLVFGG